MSDDLVKRLRDFTCDCFSGNSKHMAWEAADRIEELEKRVRQAKIVFATMRSEMSSVCAVMEAFENDR
jgi:hypothetical protein